MAALRAEQITRTEILDLATCEDKALALAFKEGCDGAYQAIYDRFSTRVHSVCRRMLGDRDDAAEASQEVFLRVYQALPRFNGRYQMGAWVTRIATNVCLDQLRSRNRKPATSTPLELLDLDPSGPAEDTDPEELYMRKTEGRKVRRVLASLPPMHRAAIVLRDFEGLSYADIGTALSMTECQVKALIHRARKGFKKTWSQRFAALLPLRFVQRFVQKVEGTGEQATQTVASYGPVVSTCSSMLQQCGQAVADKVAPFMTAAVAGVALVTGAAQLPPPGPLHEQPATISAVEPAIHAGGGAEKEAEEKEVSSTSGSTLSTTPEAKPIPEEVEPEPEPAPAPEPSPSPPPESGGSTTPGGTAPQNQTGPAPFAPAVGFDNGQPLTTAQGTEHVMTADCAAHTFEQRFKTSISNGTLIYEGFVHLVAGPETGKLNVSLWKNGTRYDYASWGFEPRSTWELSGSDQMRVTVTGDYGPLYGENPGDAGLPESGTFAATVTLDCTTPTVVTETLALGVL